MRTAMNRHARAGGSAGPSTPARAGTPRPVQMVLDLERARTRRMVRDALDAFERGATTGVFSDPRARGAAPTPDQLIRAAILAGWGADHARSRGYLDRARAHLAGQVAGAGMSGDDTAWALSMNAGATGASAAWMLSKVDEFIADPATFAAQVAGAKVQERFDEPRRMRKAISGALTRAAGDHTDEAARAFGAQAARMAGAEHLAEKVAAFDHEQTRALGRVLRALEHDPTILAPAVTGHHEQLALGAMQDIAAGGKVWRAARLGALIGREEEIETLRTYGRHLRRSVSDGSGLPDASERHSARYRIALADHQLRVAREARMPMRVSMSVDDDSDLADAFERLARRPGRVRCRAVRVPARGTAVGLAVALTYEGVDADSGEPLELTIRRRVGESRQAKVADQRARLVGNLPAGCPPVEDGYWDLTHEGAFTPVIAGPPDPGPAPAASLDAHLGPVRTCTHPDARWVSDGVFQVAECVACGDRLVRRPSVRFGDPIMARANLSMSGNADGGYGRVAALACLVGAKPPGSIEELTDAPRITDWRAEWRKDHAGARASTASVRTIAEVMRRR